MANKTQRELVVVSGYYGFDNLGDEAILEQLISELSQLVGPANIVVLSQAPDKTKARYGVGAINRWKMLEWLPVMKKCKLFVSGGGGLFQDVTGPASVVYYGGQILLANCLGAKTLVYAQGLGPLKSPISRTITKVALSVTDFLSVRDAASFAMLAGWSLPAALTADPVWALEASDLPASIENKLEELKSRGVSSKLIGLSLRESSNFTGAHFEALLQSLLAALPAEATLLLLPLQQDQDLLLLESFQRQWQQAGRRAELLDAAALERPSQWVSLLGQLDLLVAMRLHAVIMALKSGVPTVGVAYDPKVSSVLNQFQQPVLNLTNEQGRPESASIWTETLKSALADSARLSMQACECASSAKTMACQNFDNLARMLNMQSDRQTVR